MASRRLALDWQLLAYHAQRFPGAVVADLVRVGRIDFFDVDVALVSACDRQPPRQPLVVTDGDADKRRFAGADDVPPRRSEMHDVAQRRIGDLAVRIVRDDRLARHRVRAADHPVVAARLGRGVLGHDAAARRTEQMLIGGRDRGPRHAACAATARSRPRGSG